MRWDRPLSSDSIYISLWTNYNKQEFTDTCCPCWFTFHYELIITEVLFDGFEAPKNLHFTMN